jgi:hypothetical protein
MALSDRGPRNLHLILKTICIIQANWQTSMNSVSASLSLIFNEHRGTPVVLTYIESRVSIPSFQRDSKCQAHCKYKTIFSLFLKSLKSV